MGEAMRSKLLLLLVVSLLFFGCSKKNETKEQQQTTVNVVWDSTASTDEKPEFIDLQNQVLYRPSGIISLNQQLVVKFEKYMIPNHQRNIVLTESPFTFEPPIDGHAKWISRDRIAFIPDENYQMDTEYTGVLKGEILLGHDNVSVVEFSFTTPKQELKNFEYDFLPVNDAGKGMVKLSAQISFYKEVDLMEFQEDLELKLENKNWSFVVTSNSETEFQIESSPFPRKPTVQYLNITLPKNYTSSQKEWSKSVTITEIGKFKVFTSMDMSENENTKQFGVRFSDKIETEMDISGYVTIKPEIEHELVIRDKYLIVKANFLAGKNYSLTIEKGLPAADGRKLESTYFKQITFSNIKPKVEWLSEGVFLPNSNENTLQFKSVNLKKVHITVFQVYEENMGFFLQQNSLTDMNNYSELYRVGEEVYSGNITINAKRNIWNVNNVNIGKILEKNINTGYIVTMTFSEEDLLYPVVSRIENVTDRQLYYEGSDDWYSFPGSNGYYNENGRLSKLVLLSDVALTVKKTKDETHVFAVDILKAEPVVNYNLDMYNYQNKVIESAKTDRNGCAVFIKDDGYSIRGEDAMIKLNGKRWETSSFNVAGTTKGKKGLKVYMYTDRGVYRPGDEVHLSSIIRTNSEIPPADQPVILKLRNPMDQVILEQKTTVGKYGHCTFDLPVAYDAPTGNWKTELHFTGEEYYQWLKIETVKPNRIKVQMDFPDEIVGKPLELEGKITSKYLFGAPGADLPVLGEMFLSARNPVVREMTDYSFSDPMLKFESRNRVFAEGTLDDQGEKSVNYAFKKEAEQVNCINAQLKVTVSEKGGSKVTEYQNVLVMSDTVLPGIKVPESRYLKRNVDYNFPIVVSNLDGELVTDHKLKITHYVNHYYWWWEYHNNGREKDFRKAKHTISLGSQVLMSGSEPTDFTVKTEDRGLHYIHVLDTKTGRSCGIKFYVSWWGDRSREEDEKEQDFLQITFDKEKYHPGEKAKVNFDSPSKGTYLLTIEQDGEILKKKVKKVSAGNTSVNINITDKMIPNCYLSLSLIQPHGQMENDIPIRNYGIKPIFVEDPDTRLDFEMDVPEVVKPKEKFEITIRNNSNQAGSATIAIVDNGLLDLTHFKTPRPWDFYYQKLCLGTTTLDNYDEIIGTLLPDVDNEFTIGGGMAMKKAFAGVDAAQRVKRFKAAVVFRQLPELKAGSENTFEFTMPDYIGSMRVMLVGCSERGFTSVEKDMIAKTPLLVLPTIPRVIHPGDEFKLPVSIFALEDSIKDVNVSLEVSEHLEIIMAESYSVTFDKKGEKEVYFEVVANEIIGGAKITLTAKSANETTVYTVDLPVSPANPYMTEVTDTIIMNKGGLTLVPNKIGLENTNTAKLVFTKIPDIKLEKHLNHLIRYPYGCIEQTTSSTFAQLYLNNLMDLSTQREQRIHSNVNRGIERLPLFVNSKGFSYWPGGYENTNWCTSYVGHFLFSAKELGYHIPSDLENHWLKTAKKQCRDKDEKNYRYQAYTLFVLAYSGNPEFGSMNLLRENYIGKMDPVSKTLLATAYYISGKESAAREILHGENRNVLEYREFAGTYGSQLRDQALIAYCAVLMKDFDKANKLMKVITKKFENRRWFSTQELNFTLLALSKFYLNSGFTQSDIPFIVKIEGEEKEYMLSDYLLEIEASDLFGKEIEIKSNSDAPLFVYLYESGIPMEDIVKTEKKGLSLTRSFFDEDGNTISVDSQDQGKSFWIVYHVESDTRENIEEIALSSMFPAGWEIINPRMSEEDLPTWIRQLNPSTAEYMDIRDDRVNWFFDLYGNSRKFVIEVNPTFKGDYVMPPVNLEAMYSPDYYSRIKSGKVVVK